MKRLFLILFWSVIAAAFIGPGTVTTAATAGANHRFALLWALLFSTAACLSLQEASARITIASGHDLAQALRLRFRGGASGAAVLLLVLGAIVLGCAAYEAGNILGAVAGASLGFSVPRLWLTSIIGATAGALLWFGSTRTVARILGMAVAVMGVAFVATAARLATAPTEIARGLLVPSLPTGSALLVLGLIGTTVVPYNLFLGSGLARGQRLGEVRFGLAIAVGLGGLISMAVLVVGTAVSGTLTFENLGTELAVRLGGWATGLFALGLFAAGISSAMTAPLAAAVTARGLFERQETTCWNERSWRYRSIWLLVLVTGIIFGLTGIRAIPVILLAQALNGILLPFVSVFLLILVNDRGLMGDSRINGWRANAAMGLTVAVTIVLGTSAVVRAVASSMGWSQPAPVAIAAISGLALVVLGGWLVMKVRRARSTTTAPR